MKKRSIGLEVVIISKRSEGLYADIPKRVKADPEITDLDKNISRIKRFTVMVKI